MNEKQHIDITRIPIMVGNDVGGTSAKNFVHWKQNFDTGMVRQFEFGEERNILVYNQTTPPLYAIETLKERLAQVHIQIFVGDKDIFTQDSTV